MTRMCSLGNGSRQYIKIKHGAKIAVRNGREGGGGGGGGGGEGEGEGGEGENIFLEG